MLEDFMGKQEIDIIILQEVTQPMFETLGGYATELPGGLGYPDKRTHYVNKHSTITDRDWYGRRERAYSAPNFHTCCGPYSQR